MPKLLNPLLLSILITCSGCELLQKNSSKADPCSSKDLHPKTEATCSLKRLLKTKKNKQINKIVSSYEKQGLQSAEEYNVIFVGGNGSGETLNWTYLVGVDFYDLKTFRSLIVAVTVYDKKPAKIKDVMSKSQINNWLK